MLAVVAGDDACDVLGRLQGAHQHLALGADLLNGNPWAAMQWRRHGISVGLGSLSALELVPVQQHCRIRLDLLRGPFLNGGYIGVVLNRGVALDAAGMLRCRAILPESFEVDVEAGHAVSLEVGAAALGRSGDDLSRPDSTKQAIGRKGFSLALAALCLSALGVDSTKHPA